MFVAFLLCFLFSPSLSDSNSLEDEEIVLQIQEEFVKNFNKGNISALPALFESDAKLTWFSKNGNERPLNGREEIMLFITKGRRNGVWRVSMELESQGRVKDGEINAVGKIVLLGKKEMLLGNYRLVIRNDKNSDWLISYVDLDFGF